MLFVGTHVDKELLTIKKYADYCTVLYNNEQLEMETCILAVHKITKQNGCVNITFLLNGQSQNNKFFTSKMLLLEQYIQFKTGGSIDRCIYRENNNAYMHCLISEDTVIFNRHKKQVSLEELFINAHVKCLLLIKDLNIKQEHNEQETQKYKYIPQIKQLLIINSF